MVLDSSCNSAVECNATVQCESVDYSRVARWLRVTLRRSRGSPWSRLWCHPATTAHIFFCFILSMLIYLEDRMTTLGCQLWSYIVLFATDLNATLDSIVTLTLTKGGRYQWKFWCSARATASSITKCYRSHQSKSPSFPVHSAQLHMLTFRIRKHFCHILDESCCQFHVSPYQDPLGSKMLC